MLKNKYVHPSADIDKNARIGEGTRVWHQAQIMPNAIVGKNCNIGKGVFIDTGVSIGDNVKIQNGVSVYKGVSVESDCFLGPNATFTNDMFPRSFTDDFEIIKTSVKKGASIGANATIICGITIGSYAMIGAGSVVTKDVNSHSLVVGNPAKVVGRVCKCGKKIALQNTIANEDNYCSECKTNPNI